MLFCTLPHGDVAQKEIILKLVRVGVELPNAELIPVGPGIWLLSGGDWNGFS